jgi:hypothetical protein
MVTDILSQLNDDKAVLVIDYGLGDSADYVTQDIALGALGLINDSVITWESSNPLLIAISETAESNQFDTSLTRPDFGMGDKEVKLTATIEKGQDDVDKVSVEKVFILKVIEKEGTDLEMLDIDTKKVDILYGENDSSTSVTEDLTFAYTGSKGTSIVWESSDSSIILINADSGQVTRPTITEGDRTVTVTATLSRASETEKVVYEVIVKAQENSEENSIKLMEADLADLEVGYRFSDDNTSVTTHVILAVIGEKASSIKWSSNNIVVANNGTVVRGDVDTQVLLTATVTNGTSIGVKTFTLTVKAKELDLLAQLGADANLASIVFAQGEDSSNVTQDLNLMTLGSNGCTWSWSSSDQTIISNTGIVTRPSEATEVKLRVAISQQGYVIYREYIVTVK